MDAALAAEQAKSEKLVDSFRETFKGAFRFGNNKAFAGMGHPVGVRVLTKAEMQKEAQALATYLHEEDVRALLKFNPQYVQNKLVKYYGHDIPDRLLDMDEHTQLTREEIVLVVGTQTPVRVLSDNYISPSCCLT